MATYSLEARHRADQHLEEFLDRETLAGVWAIFVHIGQFWKNDSAPEAMRSNFLVFIENRIRMDASYVGEYRNATAVVAELTAELGEAAAYEKLFTDPAANISPPTTRLARARQLVSNELVALQLALGGFRAWGAVNYLGYIGGANVPGHPPYRVYRRSKK